MAVADSTNLQMTKMDLGVQGKETIFNTDVDLLDAVVGGYAPISMTTADFDLSETQQLNAVLEFTGTIGAARTVFVDVTVGIGKPRRWVFFNNTTGGFALTFKLKNSGTGFGTGATLTATKTAEFYHTNAGGGANGDIYKFTTEV